MPLHTISHSFPHLLHRHASEYRLPAAAIPISFHLSFHIFPDTRSVISGSGSCRRNLLCRATTGGSKRDVGKLIARTQHRRARHRKGVNPSKSDLMDELGEAEEEIEMLAEMANEDRTSSPYDSNPSENEWVKGEEMGVPSQDASRLNIHDESLKQSSSPDPQTSAFNTGEFQTFSSEIAQKEVNNKGGFQISSTDLESAVRSVSGEETQEEVSKNLSKSFSEGESLVGNAVSKVEGWADEAQAAMNAIADVAIDAASDTSKKIKETGQEIGQDMDEVASIGESLLVDGSKTMNRQAEESRAQAQKVFEENYENFQLGTGTVKSEAQKSLSRIQDSITEAVQETERAAETIATEVFTFGQVLADTGTETFISSSSASVDTNNLSGSGKDKQRETQELCDEERERYMGFKVLVAGASGRTGRLIVDNLVSKGIAVRALVRDAYKGRSMKQLKNCEVVVADLYKYETLKTTIGDCNAVICAIGARAFPLDPLSTFQVEYEGLLNLVSVAKNQGKVKKFIYLSSIGVTYFQFIPLLFWKKQAELYLQRSGLHYTIVRPGGLTSTNSVTKHVVMQSADTQFFGSISREKVAEICVMALLIPDSSNKVVEVVAAAGTQKRSIEESFRQYVSNDYHHSYMSSLPSTFPYANANIGYRGYIHPSFGTSSGSAVVYEDESQRFPRPLSAAKSGPCAVVSKATATAATSNNSRTASEKDESQRIPKPLMAAKSGPRAVVSKATAAATSSNSRSMSEKDESQRIPRLPSAKSGPCAVVSKATTAATSSNFKSITEKKSKDDKDLCVPTLRDHDKMSGKNPQRFCVSSTSDAMKSLFGDLTSSIMDSLPGRSTNCIAELKTLVLENQRCNLPEGKSAEMDGKELISVADEKQPRQVVQQSGCKVFDLQTGDCAIVSPGRSGQQYLPTDVACLTQCANVCQERPVSVHSTAEAGRACQSKGAGECASNGGDEHGSVKVSSCNLRSSPPKGAASSLDNPGTSTPPSKDPETSLSHKCNSEFSFPSEEDPETVQSHRDDPGSNKSENICSPTLEENNAGGCSTEKVSGHESSGDWDNLSNGNGEVLEPSHHGTGNPNGSDGSDLPMLDSVSAPSVSPKDVIQAVGQYKFWSARRAILRQQQIFSDQVFELHKLIEIQRLLSETPNILIEDLYFGTAAITTECDANPSHFDNAEKQNYADKEAQNQVSVLNEVKEGHSVGAAVQPGLPSCYPGWFQVANNDTNSQMYLGTFPSVPAFIPGGMSAWGYPSLGAGNWMYPMPAQPAAFVHQPFVGHCRTGIAVSGAYDSAGLGPGAPGGPPQTASFSFSGCDQRPELPSQMNYGIPLASSPQLHSAMCYNPFGAPSFLGSWHAIQPSSSAASITNQPGEPSHTKKKSSVPDVQSELGMNCRKRRSDSEGLHRSECQADQSVANGLNSSLLARVLSVPISEGADIGRQGEQGWAQRLHLDGAHGCAKIDSHGDGSSLAHKKDSDNRTAVWLKRQERVSLNNKVSDEQRDVNLPVSRSVDASTLFPLLPSLSSVDHGRRKPVGETEKWQGKVIKVVPRAAVSASESAAGILLSLQQERQQ